MSASGIPHASEIIDVAFLIPLNTGHVMNTELEELPYMDY